MEPVALGLVAHLIGDYALQSHAMATRKTSSWRWAAIHAAFYSIPFVLLAALSSHPSERWAVALAVIAGTHAAIDRLGIAGRWCRFYGVGHPGLWARPEHFEPPPPYIGAWLTIIVDNSMHVAINSAAILWVAHAR